MAKLSLKARSLWAKKPVSGPWATEYEGAENLWLPLAAHMGDAGETARIIWNRWLPEGTKKRIAWHITSPEERIGDEDFAGQVFVFLAAAHDLGKASPVFQTKDGRFGLRDIDERLRENLRSVGLPLKDITEYSMRNQTPHAIVSQVILERFGFDESLAVVEGSHHGKPPSDEQLNGITTGACDKNCGFDDERWQSVQRELLDYALELAELSLEEAVNLKLKKPAQVLLSALVIMVDWIASDEKRFPHIDIEETVRLEAAAIRAEEAWDDLKLPSCWSINDDWDNLYQKHFDNIKDLRPVQETLFHCARKCLDPGIFVVEAPMGEGKTEAALAAAEVLADRTRRGGLFFALPTQATTDAMFPRVLKWLEKVYDGEARSVLLAHGKADLNEDYRGLRLESVSVGDDGEESVIVHSWLSGRKKGLLSDFVIGTIDHVLMAGLKQKHVMLRHLGLANKVVIIDECHAYDAYMSEYLEKVLNWLGAYGVPVIILSATLPAEKRKQVIDAYWNESEDEQCDYDPLFDDVKPVREPPQWATSQAYPLITWTDGKEVKQEAVMGGKRSINVTVRRLPDADITDVLEDSLSGGGCVGIIVNTVGRAQEFYRVLSEHFGEDCVCLLHGRFISLDRAKKENDLKEMLGPPDTSQRPEKLIVVGTQVLEQSLDIDFDLLVTDLCPMDLLIQRMGRLHRHERERPEKLKDALCIVTEIEGEPFGTGAEKIYGKYLLMRTNVLLPERVILPDSIPELVQEVYGENDIPLESLFHAEYEKAREKWKALIRAKKNRAEAFQVSDPFRSEDTLVNWLNTKLSDSSEKRGEAAVRDGADSIEVIVIRKKKGIMRLLPWIEKGREIPRDRTPDDELARVVASCTVRLPTIFSAPRMIDRAVEELEKICHDEKLDLWQKTPWLKGELFLILDENLSMELCGYRLQYDQYVGLTSKRTEE